MLSKTRESNLEDAIEHSLLSNKYVVGLSSDFNKQYAVDEKLFWQFIEDTQPEELEKLKYKANYKQVVLDRLDKLVKSKGVIEVLQKGLKVEGAKFNLFFSHPNKNASEREINGYEKSIYSVTRQVYYSNNNNNTIDMVIFINGLPLITLELKNEWTNQTAKYHAIKQYKTDRDPKEPLLNFGRCIVHFAIDTNEVYMTTKLDKGKTHFLPFNKGNNNGAGNPTNIDGHRSSYLWEEILSKKNLADIISNYVLMTCEPKISNRTVFFPRYHQFDVVTSLLQDVKTNNVGQSYLIQHSAGSGKSNSITWLSYQLINLLDTNDDQLFDSVIIVTDRRLLDSQLGENIKKFSRQSGLVKQANSSKDLREGLENGIRIMTTTIQKFPFIVDEISDMSTRKFAVIIDEAHSSQGGSAAGMMNQAMGISVDDELDTQDRILEIVKSRQVKSNVSYFAFTATPKNSTLERFGTKQEDGSFVPFHLYSMKQAIEEGFILDVLSNYTKYSSYYELEKSIEDNPEFNKKRAQTKLKKYVENDVHTINTKAAVMVNHFTENVVSKKRLNSKGKAMIVTQSIEQAIKYYKAVNEELGKIGNPYKVLIAFSGEKEIDGIQYTETQMNGISEKKTKDTFDEDEYKILIVANKYLTGFDQPKLCAMYVDKKLSGVLCVQALSRLNRAAYDLNKRTEDLFVLDFYNSAEDIKTSFDPFYTSTSLSQATDVNVLHDIKDSIDYEGVYSEENLTNFCELYFNGADAQLLSPILDCSADNFNYKLELTEEKKIDFKIKCKQFVKVYGQLSAIIPFAEIEWEQLYWYLKFLIPKLKVNEQGNLAFDEILDTVDLSTYALKRIKIGEKIELDDEASTLDPNSSNPHGIHNDDDDASLDDIIKDFNDRWFEGTDLADSDVLIKLSNKLLKDDTLMSETANSNDRQNFEMLFADIVKEEIQKSRKQEIEFYKLFQKNEEFKLSVLKTLENLIRKAN